MGVGLGSFFRPADSGLGQGHFILATVRPCDNFCRAESITRPGRPVRVLLRYPYHRAPCTSRAARPPQSHIALWPMPGHTRLLTLTRKFNGLRLLIMVQRDFIAVVTQLIRQLTLATLGHTSSADLPRRATHLHCKDYATKIRHRVRAGEKRTAGKKRTPISLVFEPRASM